MDPDKQVQSLYSAILFCSTATEVAGDAGAPGAAASRPFLLPRAGGGSWRGAGPGGRGARQGLLRAGRPGCPHAGAGGWQDLLQPSAAVRSFRVKQKAGGCSVAFAGSLMRGKSSVYEDPSSTEGVQA